MNLSSIEIGLPEWLLKRAETFPDVLESVEARMDMAIELARLNVKHGTGGPFGAVICEQDTGSIVAPGVNLVVSARCSVAHGSWHLPWESHLHGQRAWRHPLGIL